MEQTRCFRVGRLSNGTVYKGVRSMSSIAVELQYLFCHGHFFCHLVFTCFHIDQFVDASKLCCNALCRPQGDLREMVTLTKNCICFLYTLLAPQCSAKTFVFGKDVVSIFGYCWYLYHNLVMKALLFLELLLRARHSVWYVNVAKHFTQTILVVVGLHQSDTS